MRDFKVLLLLAIWLTASIASALPWPGEPWQESQNLTELDDDFGRNLSGAHWNAETRTLWVCVNAPGKFLALVEDGAGGFKVAERAGQRAEWAPGGDLEAITQVNLAEQAVYVLAEGEDVIRKFDTSTAAVRLLASWNIRAFVPTSGGAGSEGIAFVPDSWLVARGFVDRTGTPYTSKGGMGGLVFVAHQNGGAVYAFDLSPAGGVVFVGSYQTTRTESSGLEFDRSSGRLYVWHNIGSNYLEEVDLASTVRADGRRQFRTFREWDGPKTGNLEGVALTPTLAREHGAFLVDDDGQNGYALMRFWRFAPDIARLDVRVAASADDAEESATGTVGLRSTDLELVQDTSRQTVGIRFRGVAIPAGAHVVSAYIQFSTDEIGSAATTVEIRAQAVANAPVFAATVRNISVRPRTTTAVAWTPVPWPTVDSVGAAQRTPNLGPLVQELIGLPGWQAGNMMVFVVTGTGRRTAEAYDGDRTRAPLLHIEYEP